jgi:hypothetical protein
MAEGNITVVDQKPIDKLPYDPNDIPDAVKKRAAAVNALYSNGNGSTESGGEQQQPPVPPEPAPVLREQSPTPQASTPVPPTPTPADPSPSPAEPAPPPADEGDWKLRYERMHGRYNASQKTIGEMQEQMTQLGNELLLLQRMPPQSRQQSAPPPPPEAPAYLTETDVQNYGNDLLDVTQRAALHAVAPHLQALESQNAELQRRLAVEARRNLDQQVELAVPNYREIDRDPRWHRWLLGVDVLSGRVRQQLLNEAISTAQALRVISFFKGFLNEEAATGHNDPALTSHQPAAPREAAIDLGSLAAPGRARPATGGDASLPPERPIYTRAQIRDLYSAQRKGAYVGREAEWARQEADIIAAGREGRIR